MKTTIRSVQIILGIFAFCLVNACGNTKQKKYITIEPLPISDTLVAHPVSLKGKTELLEPFRILNAANKYLIISERTKNNFIHVFKLPELAFLYDWGHQGRGPNEFMRPPYYINLEQDQVIFYEGLSRELRTYAVKDTALVKKQVQSLIYKTQMAPLNRIRRINDSLYFADYGSSFEDTNHEHIALQPDNNKPLFTFGQYPDTELKGPDRYFTYLKTTTAKPDGSKFAAFYVYYNKFKIYNDQGKKLKTVKINNPDITNKTKTKKDFIYRFAAFATNKRIYTLGIYATSKKLSDDSNSSFKTTLEVWNWTGEPLYRATFDRRINGFTVSEKYNKLYGFSILKMQEIYVYHISTILKRL